MNNLYVLILGLVTITLLVSCNEEDPCPSCIDSKVTCKVNGKAWSANCKGDGLFGCRPITCYYYIKDGFGFDLNCINESGNSGIVLTKNSSRGGLQLGVNYFNFENEFQFWDLTIKGNCTKMELDTNFISSITLIKHDSILSFVEGTFYGRAINECGYTALITDGYFKTNYFY